jgi:hypothetical protein
MPGTRDPALAPVADAVDEGLRRDVGFFGLLWISAGTTLGSGWVFGAFVAPTTRRTQYHHVTCR